MRRPRRTKKAYSDLFANPTGLFPGIKTTLFPNGEREIWFQDDKGHSLAVRVATGPAAGMSVTIHRHVGTPPFHVRVYDKTYQQVATEPAAYEVCMTLYNQDDRSQAFKRWYDEQETSADIALLGPEYRRLTPSIPDTQQPEDNS